MGGRQRRAHNGGKFTRPLAGVHHVVFTYDTTLGTALNVKAYVDGVAQTITQTFSDNTASANFGNYLLHLMAQSDETVFWPATYLDEVRLSSSIRSAAWITTDTTTKARQEHLSPWAARVALRQHLHPLLLVHQSQPLLRLHHHLHQLLLRLHHHSTPTPTTNSNSTNTYDTNAYGYTYTGTD